jgi:hypothetical protein
MYADGDSFDQSGVLERKGVRKFVYDVLGNRNELGKSAVPAILHRRDADDLTVIAKIHFAAGAEKTFPAVHGGIESYTVAGGDMADVRADACNLPGCFVPHYQRRVPAAGGAIVAVYIAAANTAGSHTDKYIFRADFGLRHIDHLEFLVFR